MEKAAEPWRGCDPALHLAIEVFMQKWGPYSAQSRRYSIFRLFREVIDPAWTDLCARHPELKIDGHYVALSDLARHHGFGVLDRFLRLVIRYIGVDLVPSIDSIRELALACRNKKAKKISGTDISTRRHAEICRFCEKQTEIAAYLDGNAPWPGDSKNSDDPSRLLRLSAMYCNHHRPKAGLRDNKVNKIYRAAKRRKNEDAFDRELERLERQSWAGVSAPRGKSGSQLVDEFIWRLAIHRGLLLEQQPADRINALESKLKHEARSMVDGRISDRKKEIVALLTHGCCQSEVARQLGIGSRQAVSKALQSISAEYRLDLFVN